MENLYLVEQEVEFKKQLQLWRGEEKICAVAGVKDRKTIEKMVEAHNYVQAMEAKRRGVAHG